MTINFNNKMLLNDELLPIELCVATGFVGRLRGLLFTKNLSAYQGMYIKYCSEVHSFGMAYALDVVFLNSESRVIKLDILPRRRMRRCRGAASVIELSEGNTEKLGLRIGDHMSICSELEFEEVLS